MKEFKKHFIFLLFLVLLFVLSQYLANGNFANNAENKLVLSKIQELALQFQNFYNLYPALITLIFCSAFFLTTICYIPFTGTLFVLFAGALFGFYKGLILFSFLVSISYTISFLISKHFLFSFFQRNLGKRAKSIITDFEKDGVIYLLSIRLSGLVPAVALNSAMGLTKVTTTQFYFTTQIGTFPHIIAMMYAGSNLIYLDSLQNLIPAKFIFALFFLSLIPVLFKMIVEIALNFKKSFS